MSTNDTKLREEVATVEPSSEAEQATTTNTITTTTIVPSLTLAATTIYRCAKIEDRERPGTLAIVH